MAKLKLDVEGSTTLEDVKIPVSGALDAAKLMDVKEIETGLDMSNIGEFAAELAFMEEPVTIHLHESTNPQDEPWVFCGVNGEYPTPGNPWLKRGMDHVIKRKFVNNLFTAKKVSYSQPFARETSDKANYMRPHTAVHYPFSIVADSNPKGATWARQMMGA